jgi:hypothetical protein
MHPLITNISAQTFDVHSFSFESASALEIDNEYSGLGPDPNPLPGGRFRSGRADALAATIHQV